MARVLIGLCYLNTIVYENFCQNSYVNAWSPCIRMWALCRPRLISDLYTHPQSSQHIAL